MLKRVGSFLPHTVWVTMWIFWHSFYTSQTKLNPCLCTQVLSQFLMLKPIINQKWARPPTWWKASGAQAWQSPTSFVLPLSRLDNHPGNVNVIILKILSQVWTLSSSFLFDFSASALSIKSFYIIIYTKLTHKDYTTNEWTVRSLLDVIEIWPSDEARWGEYLLIIRWQMAEGIFRQPVAISLLRLSVALAGYWAVVAMQRWGQSGLRGGWMDRSKWGEREENKRKRKK